MGQKINSLIALGVAIALVVSIAAIVQVNNPPDVQRMDVTNFDSIHLSDVGGTATPVLRVNQDGTGRIVEFLDASTPVWSIDDGGAVTTGGNIDLDGNDLIIDTDGDSILDENTDDAIRLTLGATTGTFSVLTGNFKVGNGSPDTSQDAEDAYVEGGFEVDGTSRFDGTVDINNNIDLDGASDETQLAVTSYTTQTNDLVTFDGGLVDIGGGSAYDTADGDNDLGVDGDLEVDATARIDGTLDANSTVNIDGGLTNIGGGTPDTADGDNDLYVNAVLEVDGTTQLDGTLDINNDIDLDGVADEAQLVVTGYTTQTTDLVQFDGGLFDIGGGSPYDTADADNDVGIAGDLEVDGVCRLDGSMDINDNVALDGIADEIQLAVTGYTTQTTDLATFDGGLVDIGGGSAYDTADGDNDLGVDGDLEVDGTTRLDGAIDANSTSDFADSVTLSNGNLTVADLFIVTAQSSYDVTSDAVITPTGTYMPLTSSGSTTPTVTTSGITAGTLLVLINTAAQDVLIKDTGTMMLTGDLTLNQYDTLVLWFDGTNWLEISTSNN